MTTILPKPLPLRWCECPTDRQRPALDDDYVGEYDVVDECHVGGNTDENTGKLHLVIDDTEAEHVRVSHQYFLVLIKKSFLHHGSQIKTNLERIISEGPAGGKNALDSPNSVHCNKTSGLLRHCEQSSL